MLCLKTVWAGILSILKEMEMTHIPISRKTRLKRHSTQLTFEHKFGEKDRIDFKNSVTYFNRNIGVPTYTFEGTQVSTFSELTYTRTNQKNRMGGWSQLMDRQI